MTKSVDAEIKNLTLCEETPLVEEPPPSQPERSADERENLSKTLPRNYSLSAAGGTPVAAPTATKRASRPPRAQSDPTSSAKVEKKSVAVSASTQDNLGSIFFMYLLQRGNPLLQFYCYSSNTQ